MAVQNKKKYILILLLVWGWSCTGKQIDRSPHIQGVDKHYQNRRFAQALSLLRPRTQKSQDKDRLLYLMEAGTILHTLRQWEKSNLAFLEADEIAENIRLSREKEILSFFINKNEQNFVGENYERVKLKLYIALNYLMLGDKGKGLAYIRALNQELADIRFEGSDYKQNFAARFLGALLAEEDGDYNFARIQYNNMLAAGTHTDLAERSLFHLAILEKDREAIEKYTSQEDELSVYDTNMNRLSQPSWDEVGSLVILHESGIAPYKAAQGRVKDDPFFMAAFNTALAVAIVTSGHQGVDAALLLYFVGEAQNPIPVYQERQEKNLVTRPDILVGGVSFTPEILDDYRDTVTRNYNDKYEDYVKYNVANMATRVLTVYLAGKLAESEGNKSNRSLGGLLNLMVNVIGGNVIRALLVPDLRAWNLTYSNLQMKRIFLKPGVYQLKVKQSDFNYLSEIPQTVTIEAEKSTFVLIKSF